MLSLEVGSRLEVDVAVAELAQVMEEQVWYRSTAWSGRCKSTCDPLALCVRSILVVEVQ